MSPGLSPSQTGRQALHIGRPRHQDGGERLSRRPAKAVPEPSSRGQGGASRGSATDRTGPRLCRLIEQSGKPINSIRGRRQPTSGRRFCCKKQEFFGQVGSCPTANSGDLSPMIAIEVLAGGATILSGCAALPSRALSRSFEHPSGSAVR